MASGWSTNCFPTIYNQLAVAPQLIAPVGAVLPGTANGTPFSEDSK